MCGIVGWSGARPDAEQRLTTALATLIHRGPDGTGQWLGDSAALGHARLSIVDLEGGAQPLYARAGELVLVANGEIYNHVELRAELEAAGAVFATGSDCEVIVHGYAHWGESVLERLEGMYAFALYDSSKRGILLARDPLGMKPLFISEHGGVLHFASEIRGLLVLRAQRPEINPLALRQYMECQHSLGRSTLYAGIERVLPGEAMWLEHGKTVRRWQHWSLDSIEPNTPADPIAALDELMSTVFEQHLRADVPIGLFLSGGVDSTVLLGLMRRHGMQNIHTFSIGFPNSSVGDELDTATALARTFETEHRVITPDAQTLLDGFVETVWATDELMRDPASMPTRLLAQTVAKDMKVVFSGEGGDEAFAGYGRYRTSGIERGLKSLMYPGTGGFRARGDVRGALASQLFGSQLKSVNSDWREPLVTSWQQAPREWTSLQKMQALDLTHALPDNLLVKADRMLMAHGVEGRLPFVDRRLVSFGLALDDDLKRDRHQGKKLIRQWAQTFMPTEHFNTPKRGFYVPIKDWWQGERLRKLGETLCSNDAINTWFDRRGIQSLVNQQAKGGNAGRLLMALLQFAIWHRLFIEGSGQRPQGPVDPLAFLAKQG